jgi:predicted RecA/RadA family phage recombinase
MATNPVQEGHYVPLAAPYAVASGGGALVGFIFGIAVTALANGEVGTFSLEGVYILPKATGASTGGSQGAKAYWNNTNKNVTAASAGNSLIGAFLTICADSDATCVVLLNGTTV